MPHAAILGTPLRGFEHMSMLFQILVGAVIGILVGITGTGGAFVIPALMYLFRMDQLRAQGTALMISSVPIWVIAFIPYARSHQFDLKLGVLIALGICAGSYFGRTDRARHLRGQLFRGGLGSASALAGSAQVSGRRARPDWRALSVSGMSEIVITAMTGGVP